MLRLLQTGFQDSATPPPQLRFHAPSYHPGGDVSRTRLVAFLEALRSDAATNTARGKYAAIFGYSVGGMLAAVFQDRYPHLVDRVVLLAPAIDNYERNFAHLAPRDYWMPAQYVEELKGLPARPTIRVPTVLIHGDAESDAGGSAPWRVREWVETQTRLANENGENGGEGSCRAGVACRLDGPGVGFSKVFHPEDVGHSIDIVGKSPMADRPTWKALAAWVQQRPREPNCGTSESRDPSGAADDLAFWQQ
eukprot:g11235.t1